MERILGKCVKKNVPNIVYIVFWVASDLRPELRLVSQGGGTQVCDCTLLWSAGTLESSFRHLGGGGAHSTRGFGMRYEWYEAHPVRPQQ